ncbi:MAG: phosphoglucosamine mutase [Acidobacteriota bacterium]
MRELFGTDGIRGVAGKRPLDPATIYKLGKAIVRSGRRKVLIGRDTRISGPWIARVLEQAIRDEGGEVTVADVITTPAVAILCRHEPFDAGIVVSASHNPFQDNGIKIISKGGMKLTDEEEEWIEQSVAGDSDEDSLPQITEQPRPQEIRGFNRKLVDNYVDFLRTVPSVDSLRPLKVVLDCAHGAAFHIAVRIFEELGAEVVALNINPDGRNINQGCGAVYPEKMAQKVIETKASLGVALDGDADRAIFCDENGKLFDGDYVLYILARFFQRMGQLKSQCVVTTVMANKGLEFALERADLRIVRTRVGDRYVLARMLQGNHALGGEPSGHIIMSAHSLAGDGIVTALKIVDVMIQEGRSLEELAEGFRKFPQVLLNVRVREKVDFSKIPAIQQEIEAAETRMGETGRVLIRYSGTEQLARIMLEGEKKEQIIHHGQAIAARFEEKLGVGEDCGPLTPDP